MTTPATADGVGVTVDIAEATNLVDGRPISIVVPRNTLTVAEATALRDQVGRALGIVADLHPAPEHPADEEPF